MQNADTFIVIGSQDVTNELLQADKFTVILAVLPERQEPCRSRSCEPCALVTCFAFRTVLTASLLVVLLKEKSLLELRKLFAFADYSVGAGAAFVELSTVVSPASSVLYSWAAFASTVETSKPLPLRKS